MTEKERFDIIMDALSHNFETRYVTDKKEIEACKVTTNDMIAGLTWVGVCLDGNNYYIVTEIPLNFVGLIINLIGYKE